MKVWITKYALTTGIIESEGEIHGQNSNMVRIQRGGRYPELFHTEGKEWHRTEEAAKIRARIMRDAKIESLHKQVNKLLNLKF